MIRPSWHLVSRTILGVIVALGVIGCVPSEVFDRRFWQEGQAAGNPMTDAGLAALVKGDLAAADRLLGAAVAANPNDAYALAGMATVAEKTGDRRRARQLYAVLAVLSPAPTGAFAVPGETISGPLAEVARFKLAGLADDAPGARQGIAAAAPTPTPVPPTVDRNVITRFEILDRLLAEALITPTEHQSRRAENLGALLPLTKKPPAVGLTRAVPPVDDVVGRMRAIGRALAMGAIDPVQHAQERTLILDALLPARVRLAAPPAVPPRNEDEAERALLRLHAAKDAEVIDAGEYAAERQAIDAARRKLAAGPRVSKADPNPARGALPLSADGAPKTPARGASTAENNSTSTGYSVHLASYRGPDEASRGWAQLVRTYPRALAGMKPTVSPIDLGAGKGQSYRLTAGAFPSAGAAAAVCAELNTRHQYCQVVGF